MLVSQLCGYLRVRVPVCEDNGYQYARALIETTRRVTKLFEKIIRECFRRFRLVPNCRDEVIVDVQLGIVC